MVMERHKRAAGRDERETWRDVLPVNENRGSSRTLTIQKVFPEIRKLLSF